ncbi:hypothetical protein BJF93_11865 [Xaviernesmea oryzae]|uniref:Anti-sigma factor n=1 Tax=Xaviernesmea oryzae TaxID=464029 RepID=A0A1Q9AVD2_9HYPH|nr:anti-sigma factor [Xaviernesmea oryzae]OLP59412.1 hypothetical protein BJF93_11865 [Xaviernesmea oryzae]SEL61090.1 Transmembrane transcriptional regulator (anti-sigma factor RsiW) [Xaviernesmea oryzae]
MPHATGSTLVLRLSALIDGEVDEVERRELERLVESDDEARRLYQRLKAGGEAGQAAFETMLSDPLPLSLVRQMRNGAEQSMPAQERVATTMAKPKRVKLWPRFLCGGVALVLIGGSTGFLIGRTMNDELPPESLAPARNWRDDMIDAYRIHTRQQGHLVEMTATEPDRLVAWLSQGAGIGFALPDLADRQLTLEGGRLIVAEGKPAATLLYRNGDGDVVALCLMKAPLAATSDSAGTLAETMRDNLAMLSWTSGGITHALIGPSSDANLRGLAEELAERT